MVIGLVEHGQCSFKVGGGGGVFTNGSGPGSHVPERPGRFFRICGALSLLSKLSSSLQLLGRRQEGRDPLQKVPGHILKEATSEV